MASFGVENKSGSIQKFNPANIKYRDTTLTGFRTFLRGWRTQKTSSKGEEKIEDWVYQPFQSHRTHRSPDRRMFIGSGEIEIEERVISSPDPLSSTLSTPLNLQTNVLYYTIPNEDFAGLIRKVTFSNLDSESDLYLDVIDGLAELIPFGLANSDLDSMFRTREAWMHVYNTATDQGEDLTTTPYYHITQSTEDSVSVNMMHAGHFVVSYFEGHEHDLLPILFDPAVVFGDMDSDLMRPISPFETPATTQKKEKTTMRRRHPQDQMNPSRLSEVLNRKQARILP
jgi:hypothetical protein